MIKVFVVSLFYLTNFSYGIKLLYPAPSVFQITASFSAPIETPGRKVFLDWGLQMNYDLPSKVSQFYNVPIWPGIFDNRAKRSINSTDLMSKYRQQDMASEMHPSDFTADELYFSLENILERNGFHETCLLRSVCELARYPLATEQPNLLTETLTFTLTPSLHQSFSHHSSVYSQMYKEAENLGSYGYECADVYSECKHDLLKALTKIII